MWISSITTATGSSSEWQSLLQQRRQDFSQLAQSLQSGDLAGAQKAYADLQSLQQNSQSSPNNNASGNPIQNDLAALGQALDSNNLSQAQSAFAQLQSDLKSAYQNQAGSQGTSGTHRGHHHHHHSVSSSQTSTGSTGTTDTTDTGSQTNNSSGSSSGVNVAA